MLSGVWGKKIGMTQVFSEKNMVVPVTVIDLNNWYVTQIKTKELDGYDAIQVGCLRNKYTNKTFSRDWLKDAKEYFSFIKEIKLEKQPEQALEIGQTLDISSILTPGKNVNVFGITKGRGFQGVIKRHGFRGGPASHGPRFGRWPGTVSFMRSQGRVIKGKKLPGHMGVDQRVMKNLEIVKIENEAKIALIKGSVPGSSGSLVFMQKA
jgi:large subunit ribosomal protein L3